MELPWHEIELHQNEDGVLAAMMCGGAPMNDFFPPMIWECGAISSFHSSLYSAHS